MDAKLLFLPLIWSSQKQMKHTKMDKNKQKWTKTDKFWQVQPSSAIVAKFIKDWPSLSKLPKFTQMYQRIAICPHGRGCRPRRVHMGVDARQGASTWAWTWVEGRPHMRGGWPRQVHMGMDAGQGASTWAWPQAEVRPHGSGHGLRRIDTGVDLGGGVSTYCWPILLHCMMRKWMLKFCSCL